MDEKLTSALAKVAKLRTLAAGASTQAEAEAAYAQAEAIIAKYQLDESQLDALDPTRAEAIGVDDDALWKGKVRQAWVGHLAGSLARLHGCAVVSSGYRGNTRYSIAGRKSDVQIVRYLFAWLHLEIERLSEREHGRSARNAFRLGAVSGAVNAMKREQATAAAAAPESTPATPGTAALAVVLQDRAQDALAAFGKVRKGRAASIRDGGAYARGRAAGEGLSPRAGLEGRSSHLLT